jgi:hypothetical protein
VVEGVSNRKYTTHAHVIDAKHKAFYGDTDGVRILGAQQQFPASVNALEYQRVAQF